MQKIAARSMALLDPRSELMALPLAVVGRVLADTGEEYYRALIRARGETPEKWPRRSVAMLAIGIAAMVVAMPLSFSAGEPCERASSDATPSKTASSEPWWWAPPTL